MINDWNCVAYPSGPGALLFGLESARLPPVGNVQSGLADVTALAFDRDLLVWLLYCSGVVCTRSDSRVP